MMDRLLNWLKGIGPDVAPTVEQSKAEGFVQIKPEHSICLAPGDVMNLGDSIRLHGVDKFGSFIVMHRPSK